MDVPGYNPLHIFVGILVLTFILYQKSLNYDFSKVDDNKLITDRIEWLSDLGNFPNIFLEPFLNTAEDPAKGSGYYRPIPVATLMFDAMTSGLDAGGYHRSNLIFHLLCLLAFFFLLRSLSLNAPVVLFAVGIFAIHPAATHAVCWIPGRTDLLLTLFSLLGLGFFARWYKNPQCLYWLVFFCSSYLLAALSKESGLVIPGFIAATLYLGKRWGRIQGLSRRQWMIFLGSSFLVAATWMVMWRIAWHGRDVLGIYLMDSLQYWPMIPYSVSKLAIPHQMTTLDHFNDLPLWFGLVTLPLGVWLWRFRGDFGSLMLCCVVWFLAAVTPTLIASGTNILENRLYGLLPPFVLAVSIALGRMVTEFGARSNYGVAVGTGFWCLYLIMVTNAYMPAFADNETFLAGVRKNSSNSLFKHKSASILINEGKYDEAESLLKSLNAAAKPAENVANNLGVIYLRRENLEMAERYFLLELFRYPGDPLATINLFNVYLKQGKIDKCHLIIRKGLEHYPEHPGLVAGRNLLEKIEKNELGEN